MKKAGQTVKMLGKRDPLPARWFRGTVKELSDQKFSVTIPDAELMRIGHIAPSQANVMFTREEFRIIKRRLLAPIREGKSPDGRSARVILVTSARPSEGKTFLATNLALSLAMEPGMNVVLVDGDIGEATLTQRSNLVSATGLMDALVDETVNLSDLVWDTNVPNLGIVCAGPNRPNAVEYLGSERMKQVIENLLRRSNDQVIVIDSSAVLSTSIAVALAMHAGQVLFVVARNETRRSEIEDSLNVLDDVIGPLEDANIGLVLNKISPAQSVARYSAT